MVNVKGRQRESDTLKFKVGRHVSTQGTLARQQVSMQDMLVREHVSTQGTMSRESVSAQGTLACEHVSTQARF